MLLIIDCSDKYYQNIHQSSLNFTTWKPAVNCWYDVGHRDKYSYLMQLPWFIVIPKWLHGDLKSVKKNCDYFFSSHIIDSFVLQYWTK